MADAFTIAEGKVEITTDLDDGLERKAHKAGQKAGDAQARGFMNRFTARFRNENGRGLFDKWIGRFFRIDPDMARRQQKTIFGQLFDAPPKMVETMVRPLAMLVSTKFGGILSLALGAQMMTIVGPAILSGLALGLGGGLIALAAFGQRGNKVLKKEFSETGNTISRVFRRATAPMGPVFVQALNAVQAAFVKWEKPLTRIFTKLRPALMPVVNGLLGMITNALPGLERAMPGVVTAFKAFGKELPGLGRAIGRMFAMLGEKKNQQSIREFLHGLMAVATWIFQTGIPALIEISRKIKAVSDWFSDLDNKVERAGKSTRAWLERTFDKVESSVQGWADSIRSGFRATLTSVENRVQSWSTSIRSWFSRTITKIEGTVQGWSDSIRAKFKATITRIEGTVQGWSTGIRTRFRTTLTNIEDRTQTAANRIRDYFKALPGRVWSALAQFAGKLKNRAATAFAAFRTEAGHRADAFITFIKAIPGRVVRGLGAIGSRLRESGRQLLQGLLVGVQNRIREIGGLGTWFRNNMVDPIVRGVKRFFGISSPSKVFRGIGGNIVAGLWQGIARTNPTKMIGKIFGGMPQALARWWRRAWSRSGICPPRRCLPWAGCGARSRACSAVAATWPSGRLRPPQSLESRPPGSRPWSAGRCSRAGATRRRSTSGTPTPRRGSRPWVSCRPSARPSTPTRRPA
jgi:phage-related protein